MKDNRFSDLIIADVVYIFVSFIIVVVTGLFKYNVFMYSESNPRYYNLKTDIDRIQYLKSQFSDLLTTLFFFILIFAIINIIFVIKKKKRIEIINNRKSFCYYVLLYIINLLFVCISGAVVSGIITTPEIFQMVKANDSTIINTVHNLCTNINIFLFILFLQLIIVLSINRLSVYQKFNLVIYISVPYMLYPLFFA